MATSFHHATLSLGQQTASMSPLYQRRGAPEIGHSIELMPNPDFVFPARSVEASPSLDSWNVLNRRPQSSQQSMPPPPVPSIGARGHRSRASRGSVALPDFSFNPSAAPAPASTSLATPPHSPGLPSPGTPSRAIGHRRGGSEFIGGDGKGGAGLLSTSPTKGEATMVAPAESSRLGPPAGGRGHRHRRSGAISCHDLQSIMQPIEAGNLHRGGSAPATPLDNEPKPFFGHAQSRRPASQADFRSYSPEQTRSSASDSPPRVVPRVRVGFSDRVEYIRPLSTISSETESSMSTIRGGHSVSGSLSSVISLGTSSPLSTRMARLPLQTTFEDESTKARPQSSGNILDSMTRDRQELHASSNEAERPKSAVSTPVSDCPPSSATSDVKSPKRRSFGWWDAKKPTHVLRSSISEPSLLPLPPASPDSIDGPEFTTLGEELAGSEAQKKSKKSKLWTRGLISRKSKSHNNLKRPLAERSPTPPPPLPSRPSFEASTLPDEPPMDEVQSFEPDFDDDQTVTIVNEESRHSMSISPWRNRVHADSDPISPVIDLDAALGPFRTPILIANSRGSSITSQSRPRRSMHSTGFSSSLNHRRTESAPELVPFDMRTAKLTPTSAMPDVFEEEDEEAAEAVELASSPGSELPSPAYEEMDAVFSTPEQKVVEDDITTPRRPSAQSRTSPLARAASGSPLSSSVIAQRRSSVEVVEDFEEPRASSLGRDSDSTVTPPMTANDEKAPRPLMSLQLPLPQQPIMTPDTLTASSSSSRQFSNSQVSLNTPRLNTATSSARSVTFGEPGPAVRMSVDDVPSLSSSRSTMTNPPQYPWAIAGAGASGPRSEGRKSSVGSAPSIDEARWRSKRASVASLSRLVGVKSKLSIETRPQSQHMTCSNSSLSPSKNKKKQNRLSKLMQFWKKQPEGSRRDSIT